MGDREVVESHTGENRIFSLSLLLRSPFKRIINGHTRLGEEVFKFILGVAQ